MEKLKASLSLEVYGKKVTVDFDHEDLNMTELLEAFYGMCVAHTWHPETVIKSMSNFVDEHSAE